MSFINPQTQALVRRLDWSLSRAGFGQIVQGAYDISECILNCISTIKGSDPFRPDFGSDIWEHISTPVTVAGPNMILAIRQAVTRWEPRIKLEFVRYAYRDQYEAPGITSGFVFEIGWKLVGGQVTGQTDILLGLSDTVQEDLNNNIPMTMYFDILSTETNEMFISEDSTNIIQI